MIIEVNFRYISNSNTLSNRKAENAQNTQGSELVLESQTTILMMRSELEIAW